MNKYKINVLCDNATSTYKEFINEGFDATFFTREEANKKNVSIDMLLFTGGADVDPELYGEEQGKQTSINKKRDTLEADTYYDYSHLPKLGICRGSQFLTVMSGGKLVQHVSNHTSSHEIDIDSLLLGYGSTRDRFRTYNITSTHHQMMYPYNLKPSKYDLIGWSKMLRSSTYLNGKNEEINLPEKFLEPEIVYYKASRSLCVQGHPEMSGCPSSTRKLIHNLIIKYLIKNGK